MGDGRKALGGGLGAGRGRGDVADDDHQIGGFGVEEARQGGAQAQPGRVGAIDAADQRLNQPVQRFAAESAGDESGQRFIVDVATGGDEPLGSHAKLAAPTEKW